MSLTASPYDNENIYDLAIRLYGNINGVSGLVGSLTSLDSAVTSDVTYEEIVFEDYVSKTEPIIRRETLETVVRENQSIYDLAVQLSGNLSGISSVLSNYTTLDANIQGNTISITKSSDPLIDIFQRNEFVFATKDSAVVVSDLWILFDTTWNDPNIWIDTELWSDGTPSYDAATQALINQAAIDGYTAASGSVLGALDALIIQLKADGIWALLDVLYIMATNGDSDFACYNLKDPTQYNLTKVNSPLFTSLQGFKGDGVSAYLDTNFILASNGINYTLNSASVGGYIRSNAGSPAQDTDIGVQGDNGGITTLSTAFFFTPDDNAFRINNGNFRKAVSGVNPTGLIHVNRSGSGGSDLSVYFDGVSQTTIDRAGVPVSTTVPNNHSVFLLGNNNKGLLLNPSVSQISFAFIGGDLSGLELEFYNSIQAYMTTLGTQV